MKFRLSAIDENDKVINCTDISVEWNVELESAIRDIENVSMENEAIEIIRRDLIKNIDRNILKEITKRRI